MKLLVGIERSDRTFQVLETAVERVQGDTSLTVAIVETEYGSSLERLEQEVREHLSDLSCDAEVRSFSGHAGSQLVDFAEDETSIGSYSTVVREVRSGRYRSMT